MCKDALYAAGAGCAGAAMYMDVLYVDFAGAKISECTWMYCMLILQEQKSVNVHGCTVRNDVPDHS